MKKLIFHIILFTCLGAQAQVKVNKPLELTATDPTQRQVSGVALPLDSTDAANVNSDAVSYLDYYPASGTNNISFTTNIEFDVYHEGMTFIFKVAAANTDSVTININGKGAKRIRHENNMKLIKGDLLAGGLHKIIYDGTDFRLLNNSDEGCPNAFVEVNESYCIEINERTATSYFNATKNCFNINARICTWGEWYFACQKSGLGLMNMTNNYEFIDDAHDHTSYVSIVGASGQCNTFTSLNSLTASQPYRCCYRK